MAQITITPEQLSHIFEEASKKLKELPKETQIYFNYDESGYTDDSNLLENLKLTILRDDEEGLAEILLEVSF